MSRVRPLLAGFLGGAFLLPFLLTSCSGGASSRPPAPTAGGVVSLPSQVNSQGEVQVAVDGKFRPGEPVELGVTLDTHGGSLDMDLTRVATLEDSLGNRYSPTGWQGSDPGGHHRSGILLFPPLSGAPSWLRLTLQDPYATFTWQLR